jgi:hypothetical protein
VGKEMDECGRDDDTSSELLEDDEDNVVVAHEAELPGQNWSEDSNGAGHEDDEEKTDAKADVVVSLGGITVHFFLRVSADAVLNTGMIVTMLSF